MGSYSHPFINLPQINSINSTPSHISLSDLTRMVESVIRNHFSAKTFWVVAEVSGLKYYAGKNYYFLNLVEKAPSSNTLLTSISATVWSQGVNQVRKFETVTGQRFENNLQLLLQVRVEYHITYGLKLNILDVDPRFTLGKLAMERQLILHRLVEENPGYISLQEGSYITFNQLRVTSPVIQRIALIGSPGSDGFRDFMHELESNYYGYKYRVDQYPAAVQGAGAEVQLVEKLAEIVKLEIDYDAVVIVRGGGADTDMMAFDSYLLSRAIAKFPIPVITGIGHTRNESIADMMAFRALKTPTKAAAFLIEHNYIFEEQLNQSWKNISVYAAALLSNRREHLYHLRSALQASMRESVFVHQENLARLRSSIAGNASTGLRRKGNEIHSLVILIRQVTKHFVIMQGNNLQKIKQAVTLMGPEKMLKRGFTLVYHDGKLVKNPSLLKPGELIQTVFHQGSVGSVVNNININDGKTDL